MDLLWSTGSRAGLNAGCKCNALALVSYRRRDRGDAAGLDEAEEPALRTICLHT